MSGIFGILSKNEAAPAIMSGLQKLEYRGYDSAGLATVDEDGLLERRRGIGKLVSLSDLLVREPLRGKSGIGHLRWATHGAPSIENTHPQVSGSVAVVHNGIIENFRELKASLSVDGYNQESETDTEIVALLTRRYMNSGASPFEAATEAIRQLKGAFALAFLFQNERDLIVVARRGAPMTVGVGTGEMFVASDAIALADFTDRVMYLEDGDIAHVTREHITMFDADGIEVVRPTRIIDIEANEEIHISLSKSAATERGKKLFEVEEVRRVASSNSVSVYLNLIALEQQISGFIERVRGSNSLEPKQKDRYLTFLVQIQKNIGDLSSSLPDAGGVIDNEEAEVTASYLDRYWIHLNENVEEFLSPDRTAGLTVPLGIVALSAGVGTLFGQPLLGTVFGAWLAGKVSPDKVVGKLLDLNKGSHDVQDVGNP